MPSPQRQGGRPNSHEQGAAAVPPATSITSAETESTYPFSPGELERSVNEHQGEAAIHSEFPSINQFTLKPNTRLVGVSYKPCSSAPDVNVQDDNTTTLHHIQQSHSEIQTRLYVAGLVLNIRFDPESDGLVLENLGHPIELHYYDADGHRGQQVHLDLRQIEAIPPGKWRLLNHRKEKRLDFYSFPRQFTASLRPAQAPADTSSLQAGVLKRKTTSEKHGANIVVPDLKGTDATREGSPRTVKQARLVPEEGYSVVATLWQDRAASQAPKILAPASAVQTYAPGNPLLNLPRNQAMDVLAGGTVEYVLTKQHTIADKTSAQILSTFQLGLPLSSQAMRNEHVPKIIAVKVLKVRQPEDSSSSVEYARNVKHATEAWEQEVKSHQGLDHPSIVRLYGSDARFLSLYIEHVAAKDLSRFRTPGDPTFNGTQSPEVLWRLMNDCILALSYIHAQGIRHNDIKPANILFSEERGAVICDFGLASSIDAKWTKCGTPGYLAPELLDEEVENLRALDIWALGVAMLYVLRKIPLPELYAQWVIAHMGGANADAATASDAMRSWLGRINDGLDELENELAISQEPQRKLGNCVLEMLEKDATKRRMHLDI